MKEPAARGRAPDSDSRATRLLYFAPHTILPVSRSGIQRVARQAAEALLAQAPLDLVKWDPVEGQLRYFNAFDCDAFFRTPTWRSLYKPHRYAERRRYRFADTLPNVAPDSIWLLMPEIFYHLANGKLIYRSAMAQAREHGLRTAAVFYDLIPITNASYRDEAMVPHEIYVRDLLDVDLVLPISNYSADELGRYERERYGIDDAARTRLRRRIAAVPLAEEVAVRATAPATTARDVILLLGTVEPRKQQNRVLRVMRDADIAAAHGLKIVVVGSLHPKCGDEFRALLGSNPHVEYRGYLSDLEIDELWSRTRFSVFASNDEGFGLPICESLAHGVPCLAAGFGAMREVAEPGGCLLVDVDDDAALRDGLARLSADDALVDKLREECRRRRPRTWATYAGDVLDRIATYRAGVGATSAFTAAICAAAEGFDRAGKTESWSVLSVRSDSDSIWVIGCARDPAGADLRAFAEAIKGENGDHLALRLLGSPGNLTDCDQTSLEVVLAADLWSIETEATYEALVGLAAARGAPRLLPARCRLGATGAAPAALAESVDALRLEIERRDLVARRERVFAAACARDDPEPGALLQIVISTYNRGPFVAENVRWLTKLIDALPNGVRLTVVDNASTDDTAERLESFAQHPAVEIVTNVANVGMLGNLQVCSTLLKASYTWIVGDDDFITPGTIDKMLDVLRTHRGVPLAFVNFGVYGRAALGPGDRAETLIDNPTVLAPSPSPSGVYRVRDIALEHDNLFTAIYPIIFRTDVLSACFNYTFTGAPFSSLVESIPTTKIILETYADADAYWLADVGIVGNAHNSWQRYRVQWHGVLMPLAFALACEAKVDRQTLLEWSRVHETLFEDAARLFPDQRLADHFGRDDLETSFRVFRKRLQG